MLIPRRILPAGVFLVMIFFLRPGWAQVEVVYSYPVPNAVRVSPQTGIGIRYNEEIDGKSLEASDFQVSGSQSGIHSGSLSLGADGRTVIFEPQVFFSPNEKIRVAIAPLLCLSGKRTTAVNFSFGTSSDPSRRIHPAPAFAPNNLAAIDSLPADFPPLRVTKMDNPAPGDMYLGNFIYSTTKPYGSYIMILDSSANVLGYRNMYPQWGQDFRPRANNTYTFYDVNTSQYYAMDSTLTRTTLYQTKNGYITDQHELLYMPGGGYALLGYREETVNMLPYGGSATADVIFYAFQEFDKNKKLVFQWRCDDSGNYVFTDARYEDISGPQVDYAHCNSIDYDSVDNTFILSSRSLDEVTKISRATGKIVWRLGGKNNQFTLIGDTIFFSHQHMPRLQPNGNITLFDNGNFRASGPPYSRALEYKLDETAMTVTKVWEYRHTPDIATSAMGSVERLPNGNTLIGWGVNNDTVCATEVRPDGTVTFELRLPPGYNNYRFYKFPGAHIVNTFITGFVYDDKNGNKVYDPGEGISGVTVTLSTGLTAVTSDSGKYSFPFTVLGQVTVTASGGTFGAAVSQKVTFAGKNMEVDFIKDKSGAPAQVQLISPVATTVHSDTVQFSWKALSGAKQYRLQLSSDAELANILLDDSTISATTRKFGKLSGNTTYYWHVQGRNDAGWGNYSILTSFFITLPRLPPQAVALLLPPDTANTGTGDIIFLWHSTFPTASQYKFEVDTNITMKAPIVHGTVFYDTATSLAFSDLEQNMTYYWRVIAQNDIGSAPPSVVRTFTTGGFPASSVAAPSDPETSVSPNPASGSTHIRFYLTGEKSVSLAIYNMVSILQTSIISKTLSPGTYDYLWDASGKPSGIYLYDLRIGTTRKSGTIVIE